MSPIFLTLFLLVVAIALFATERIPVDIVGVLLVIVGVGLRTRSGLDVGMLVLIAVFQLLTIPAGAHMVGRAGFRTGQIAPTDIHLGRREAAPAPPSGEQPR